MQALEEIRTVYRSPVACARSYRDRGTRVIGYFCDSLPIEIIDAAGFVAHRITGYPAPDPEVIERRLFALLAKSFWQVRQNSLEFINDSFGRIVDGTYDMLEAIVVPNTRKPLLNLYGQLQDAEADDASLNLPKRILLDRAATAAPTAAAFNRESVAGFRVDIERFAGRAITEDEIAHAIEKRREIRKLLQVVIGWRREQTPRLSGSDFLAVASLPMFLSADDTVALLRRLVQEGPGSPRSGKRVFIGGSPPDNDILYKLVEATGATVVGEDHCWGERCADAMEALTGDPVTFLANRWTRSAACAFRLPYKATLENVVARARSCAAEVAVLNVFRDDEMQVWDTPGQIDALRAAGIPVLHLSQQPHIISDSSLLADQLETFLASGITAAETSHV